MKDKERLEALNELYPEEHKEPQRKCIKCGRVFDDHDKDYLTFEGNVYIGEDNGIIGDNMPKVDGTAEGADKFKREDIHKQRICLSCFMADLNDIRVRTLDDLKQKAEKLLKQIELLNNEKPLDLPSFLKGGN